MFFVAFNYYCSVIGKLPCDILGINTSGWSRYKQQNSLPLKHCKTICVYLNSHITDDLDELLLLTIKKYMEVL